VLSHAADGIVDVLVVGGGITGAGVALEAAIRGLSVLVIDKGDWASGTSSRSSKLIHGGLRYLAQGDIALVREAARERARLHAMAPHLALPVGMMVPAGSKPGLLKVAAGLWTFERLAGANGADGHRVLGRRETRAVEPRMKASGRLAGSVVFGEYITDDARLTLETVKSAVASGAGAASYTELVGLESDSAGIRASLLDRLTNGSLVARARCLVNAGGPWMDTVRSLAGAGDGLLQLTRGIHLVVRRERLPVNNIVVLRAPDGRSTFVVPRGTHAYIGTTDTYYEGDRDEPGVSASDAAYLLEAVAATFDDPPGPDDIVGTWSGVRPLLRQEGKQPSEISRRDEILVGPGPVISIAGGKLTTYRRMAERVVARVGEMLGVASAQRESSSASPLWGGDAAQQRQARQTAPRLASSALEERLWSTYGCSARTIVDTIVQDPSMGEPVDDLGELTQAEVRYGVDHEMVAGLDDLLRRRMHVAMFDAARAVAAAPAAAHALGTHLGWSAGRVGEEAASVASLADRELATVRTARA